uniref:Testis-expressed sequence 9 protein n=1 Tax=Heliothis virescens TaxID=7102 RepID=A0A2A4JK72_HELVI
MDPLDLLAREDEFKKLNKQLEKRTEKLMKDIEHAMQKQDIFADFSSSLTLSPMHTMKKHSCETHKPRPPSPLPPKSILKKKKPSESNNSSGKVENGTPDTGSTTNNEVEIKSMNICNCCANDKQKNIRIDGDEEFLYAFVSVSVRDNVLPKSFLKDRPTIENVCKFLSSKVKLMQEQIDRLQGMLDKKASQCEGHMRQLAELEGERMSLLSKTNNMKASTADMKAKNMVLAAKLNEKERQYKEQRNETDRLTCELKRYKIKCTSVEAKSAAQQETIDNLKQQVEITKRSEKEFRDSSRNLSASHQSAISRLEAHIKLLNTRSDRQMALIDNLRRQNVLLSTDGALKYLEKDYCDFLNQEFD